MGKPDEARRILRTRWTSKPEWLEWAAAYAALDDKDEAFRLLFRMFEERDGLNYVKPIRAWTACTRILDGTCCFVA